MGAKTVVNMPASTAVLTHQISGDVGGNSQITTIEVVSDGGQFPLTELEKTETGFKLVIIGTWEAADFLDAVGRINSMSRAMQALDPGES